MDGGDGQVVFGFLPPGIGPDGARRPTRDLALPEEGHHEGLLGARASAAHQTDPAGRQRAIWKESNAAQNQKHPELLLEPGQDTY